MPTSKVRSGKTFSKRSIPVPDGMAAVMPTMRSSLCASSISAWPNTLVYCGALERAFACLPVITSNFETP